VPPPVPWRIL